MTLSSGESATETRNISRKDAKAAKMENGKFEARNPKNSKQIQMIKQHKIPNIPDSVAEFWIFRIWDLFWPRFVSVRGAAFVLRISDLDQ